MKINGFAKVYDLKKTAIRYYTSVHLLTPKATEEYLNYDACHDQMKYILKYKDMGFSIDEIADLKQAETAMTSHGSNKVRAMLEEKIVTIEEKIKEEEAQIKDLKKRLKEVL